MGFITDINLSSITEIGGIDENGEAIVVEIDESLFFQRKYHRGANKPGKWVFGRVERGSGKCFIVKVKNHTKQLLRKKIRKHILPGTHIVSDGWAAYAKIPSLWAYF